MLELVGESHQCGRLGWCVRLRREGVGEGGFLLAQDLQAGTVATDPLLAVDGRERSIFESLEVALELRLQPSSLSPSRGELLFDSRPFALDVLGRVGERFLDDASVAVEVGELGEDGGFEAVFGEPVAVALARAVPITS